MGFFKLPWTLLLSSEPYQFCGKHPPSAGRFRSVPTLGPCEGLGDEGAGMGDALKPVTPPASAAAGGAMELLGRWG